MNIIKIIRLVEKALDVRIAMTVNRKSSPAKTARYIAIVLMYEEKYTHYNIARYFKVHRSVITKTLAEADWLIRTDRNFKDAYLTCVEAITAIYDKQDEISYCTPSAFEIKRYAGKSAEQLSESYTIEHIINSTAKIFGVTAYKVKSKMRTKDVSHARHMIVLLTQKFHKELVLTQIGEIMGGRNHATIINSANMAHRLLLSDKDFKAKYQILIKLLQDNDTTTIARTS